MLHCALTYTGATGLYLALTGNRLKTPEDLLYAGLGTHFVPSEQLPALREALAKPLTRQLDKQHGMQQILQRLQPYAQEVSLPGRLQTCEPVLFQVGCDSIAWQRLCMKLSISLWKRVCLQPVWTAETLLQAVQGACRCCKSQSQRAGSQNSQACRNHKVPGRYLARKINWKACKIVIIIIVVMHESEYVRGACRRHAGRHQVSTAGS